jgi:3-methyl-2-oxobutanoate hydroxymethyltransferase
VLFFRTGVLERSNIVHRPSSIVQRRSAGAGQKGLRLSPMRVRIAQLAERKRRGEKFVMLTAYDATMARLLERAGVDVLLVGDSVATAVLGYDTTLPVTLDVMVHHAAAVVRGTERALVIADMPFLTYQVTPSEAVRNAGRLLKDAGVAAVKVEGGQSVLDVVRRLVDVGIPVMGHLGVLPQSVNQQSGYRQRGASAAEADRIHADASALADAGAFAVVLEAIPSELAARITAAVAVPTIGIGAGPDCDGQVLVTSDLLGLHDKIPPFARKYVDLSEVIVNAVRAFAADVRNASTPRARAD